MSLHVVSTKQIIANFIMTGVIYSALLFSAWWFLQARELPQVQYDNDGKCVKVLNYKNGDAFTCNDVDIVLRKYTSLKN